MRRMDENINQTAVYELLRRVRENPSRSLERSLLIRLTPQHLGGIEVGSPDFLLGTTFRTKDGESRRVIVFDTGGLIVVTDVDHRPLYSRELDLDNVKNPRVARHPSGMVLVVQQWLRFNRRSLEHYYALESSDLTRIKTTAGPNW
jgi:hypothetical protein